METGTERLHHKTIRSAGIPGGKEMRIIQIKREPLTEKQAFETLKEHGILTNHYAEQFISHPCFSAGGPQEMTTAINILIQTGRTPLNHSFSWRDREGIYKKQSGLFALRSELQTLSNAYFRALRRMRIRKPVMQNCAVQSGTWQSGILFSVF